jgi:hypothetical protein
VVQAAFVDVRRPDRRDRDDDDDVDDDAGCREGSSVVDDVVSVEMARFRRLREDLAVVDLGAGRSTAMVVPASATDAAALTPAALAAALAAVVVAVAAEDAGEAVVRAFFLDRFAGTGADGAGDVSAASATGCSRCFLFDDFIVRTRNRRTVEDFAWSLIAASTLVGANSSPTRFLTFDANGTDGRSGARPAAAPNRVSSPTGIPAVAVLVPIGSAISCSSPSSCSSS